MTISDEKIINALMTSRSKAEAARELGCSKTTIYNRFHDPEFVEKMQQANKENNVFTALQLMQARESAIKCLWDIVEDDYEDTDSRIKAADVVMRAWHHK